MTGVTSPPSTASPSPAPPSGRRLERTLGLVVLALVLVGCLVVLRPFMSGLLWAVVLTFSGGAAVRLDVECLEAEMHDLGDCWPAAHRPGHQLDDPEQE